MKAWVFQTGEYLPYVDPGSRPMRAASLVHALRRKCHEVTLWTADFMHHDLEHRFGRNTILRVDDGVEIRFVGSPGYGANVGPGRLYDHAALAFNLKVALRQVRPPDVAVVGYPPVEAASVMVNWLYSRRIPCVLDIKDQWPETLLRPVPPVLHPAGRLALLPYTLLAKRAIRQADVVASISGPFLKWSLDYAGRSQSDSDLILPLTAVRGGRHSSQELADAARWWDGQGVIDNGRPRLIYVGRLTSLLNLQGVLDAAHACPEWQVVIAGNGPLHDEIFAQSRSLPNVVVAGWIGQAQSEILHERATAAAIPYRDEPGFLLSLPNKTFDALASGLPIATCLSGHLSDFVTANEVGAVYGPHKPLESVLREWSDAPEVTEGMSERARALYENQFDHERVYSEFVCRLEEMANSMRTLGRDA